MRIVLKETKMEHNNTVNVVNEKHDKKVLKELFDRYADEFITDEQIANILEPILRLIRSGYFDKTLRSRIRRLVKKISSMFSNISSHGGDIDSHRFILINTSPVRK